LALTAERAEGSRAIRGVNVGRRSVERAKVVQCEAVPEIMAAVEQGSVSVVAYGSGLNLGRLPELLDRAFDRRMPH
jgi:hypothetical protein